MWNILGILLIIGVSGLNAGVEYNLQHLCRGRKFGDAVPNPFDCNSYYLCEIIPVKRFCEDGLHFDAKLKVCNWPDKAQCQLNAKPLAKAMPLNGLKALRFSSDFAESKKDKIQLPALGNPPENAPNGQEEKKKKKKRKGDKKIKETIEETQPLKESIEEGKPVTQNEIKKEEKKPIDEEEERKLEIESNGGEIFEETTKKSKKQKPKKEPELNEIEGGEELSEEEEDTEGKPVNKNQEKLIMGVGGKNIGESEKSEAVKLDHAKENDKAKNDKEIKKEKEKKKDPEPLTPSPEDDKEIKKEKEEKKETETFESSPEADKDLKKEKPEPLTPLPETDKELKKEKEEKKKPEPLEPSPAADKDLKKEKEDKKEAEPLTPPLAAGKELKKEKEEMKRPETLESSPEADKEFNKEKEEKKEPKPLTPSSEEHNEENEATPLEEVAPVPEKDHKKKPAIETDNEEKQEYVGSVSTLSEDQQEKDQESKSKADKEEPKPEISNEKVKQIETVPITLVLNKPVEEVKEVLKSEPVPQDTSESIEAPVIPAKEEKIPIKLEPENVVVIEAPLLPKKKSKKEKKPEVKPEPELINEDTFLKPKPLPFVPAVAPQNEAMPVIVQETPNLMDLPQDIKKFLVPSPEEVAEVVVEEIPKPAPSSQLPKDLEVPALTGIEAMQMALFEEMLQELAKDKKENVEEPLKEQESEAVVQKLEALEKLVTDLHKEKKHEKGTKKEKENDSVAQKLATLEKILGDMHKEKKGEEEDLEDPVAKKVAALEKMLEDMHKDEKEDPVALKLMALEEKLNNKKQQDENEKLEKLLEKMIEKKEEEKPKEDPLALKLLAMEKMLEKMMQSKEESEGIVIQTEEDPLAMKVIAMEQMLEKLIQSKEEEIKKQGGVIDEDPLAQRLASMEKMLEKLSKKHPEEIKPNVAQTRPLFNNLFNDKDEAPLVKESHIDKPEVIMANTAALQLKWIDQLLAEIHQNNKKLEQGETQTQLETPTTDGVASKLTMIVEMLEKMNQQQQEKNKDQFLLVEDSNQSEEGTMMTTEDIAEQLVVIEEKLKKINKKKTKKGKQSTKEMAAMTEGIAEQLEQITKMLEEMNSRQSEQVPKKESMEVVPPAPIEIYSEKPMEAPILPPRPLDSYAEKAPGESYEGKPVTHPGGLSELEAIQLNLFEELLQEMAKDKQQQQQVPIVPAVPQPLINPENPNWSMLQEMATDKQQQQQSPIVLPVPQPLTTFENPNLSMLHEMAKDKQQQQQAPIVPAVPQPLTKPENPNLSTVDVSDYDEDALLIEELVEELTESKDHHNKALDDDTLKQQILGPAGMGSIKELEAAVLAEAEAAEIALLEEALYEMVTVPKKQKKKEKDELVDLLNEALNKKTKSKKLPTKAEKKDDALLHNDIQEAIEIALIEATQQLQGPKWEALRGELLTNGKGKDVKKKAEKSLAEDISLIKKLIKKAKKKKNIKKIVQGIVHTQKNIKEEIYGTQVPKGQESFANVPEPTLYNPPALYRPGSFDSEDFVEPHKVPQEQEAPHLLSGNKNSPPIFHGTDSLTRPALNAKDPAILHGHYSTEPQDVPFVVGYHEAPIVNGKDPSTLHGLYPTEPQDVPTVVGYHEAPQEQEAQNFLSGNQNKLPILHGVDSLAYSSSNGNNPGSLHGLYSKEPQDVPVVVGYHEAPVVNSQEPATFNSLYSKEPQDVPVVVGYHEAPVVNGQDPATSHGLYSKEPQDVPVVVGYHETPVVNGQDPATSHGLYSKEPQDVSVVVGYNEAPVVNGQDPATFHGLYSKEPQDVPVVVGYHEAPVVNGQEPATFNSLYSKEPQDVPVVVGYHEAPVVNGQDPATFHGLYSKEPQDVPVVVGYHEPPVVNGQEPATFHGLYSKEPQDVPVVVGYHETLIANGKDPATLHGLHSTEPHDVPIVIDYHESPQEQEAQHILSGNQNKLPILHGVDSLAYPSSNGNNPGSLHGLYSKEPQDVPIVVGYHEAPIVNGKDPAILHGLFSTDPHDVPTVISYHEAPQEQESQHFLSGNQNKLPILHGVDSLAYPSSNGNNPGSLHGPYSKEPQDVPIVVGYHQAPHEHESQQFFSGNQNKLPILHGVDFLAYPSSNGNNPGSLHGLYSKEPQDMPIVVGYHEAPVVNGNAAANWHGIYPTEPHDVPTVVGYHQEPHVNEAQHFFSGNQNKFSVLHGADSLTAEPQDVPIVVGYHETPVVNGIYSANLHGIYLTEPQDVPVVIGYHEAPIVNGIHQGNWHGLYPTEPQDVPIVIGAPHEYEPHHFLSGNQNSPLVLHGAGSLAYLGSNDNDPAILHSLYPTEPHDEGVVIGYPDASQEATEFQMYPAEYEAQHFALGDKLEPLDAAYEAHKPIAIKETHNKASLTFQAIDTKTMQTIDPLTLYDPANVECHHQGAYFLPHPQDCRRYYVCAFGHLLQHQCGPGTGWNFNRDQCEVRKYAECYATLPDDEEYEDVIENIQQMPVTANPLTPDPFTVPYNDGAIVCFAYSEGTTSAPSWSYGTTENMLAPAVTSDDNFAPTESELQFTEGLQFNPSTTTAAPTSERENNGDIPILVCPMGGSGYLPHSWDCSKYYICVMGRPVEATCPPGLYWDQNAEYCDLAKNVNCPANENMQI